jgi:proteasome lid subunit RPN8/RPN11
MNWKIEAENHAVSCLPHESCGLLAIIQGQETYWPCKNLAESKFEYFVMSPDDWADCEDQGEIIGIVHSHPNDVPQPSENDKASCEYLGLPWYIYSPKVKQWVSFKPSGYKTPSLIGRSFVFGVHDCWSVITDWYQENRNIKIPHTKRPKTIKQFLKNPLFEKTLPKLGFKEIKGIDNLQIGDVLLMESVKNVLAHTALYLGDSTILHHSLYKLSCREQFDLHYQKATKKIYRYETKKN